MKTQNKHVPQRRLVIKTQGSNIIYVRGGDREIFREFLYIHTCGAEIFSCLDAGGGGSLYEFMYYLYFLAYE